ncbi:MAG: NADH-quinone oxidoreductase subunit J [Verrucomicrobia bacterium]|nr:NADH-quinone oxidoreductase subunit J [Verrucomicrobiota bacterium]
MTPAFLILALVTLVSAVAAMSLRNLVHCALCLAVTLAGLAGLFLTLDAEFVGFTQVLVYIGAVAILIVFAILLTRGDDPAAQGAPSRAWLFGPLVAVVVFVTLSTALLSWTSERSWAPKSDAVARQAVAVKHIGAKLMNDYVLPLEVIALLLTAALIGAVIIAMHEKASGAATK